MTKHPTVEEARAVLSKFVDQHRNIEAREILRAFGSDTWAGLPPEKQRFALAALRRKLERAR